MIQIQLQQHDPRIALEAAQPDRATSFQPFGDDGLTFADVIDIVNPLQHIPIVGTFYRKLTGDTIDPAMRIAGGALYGGPLGAVASTMVVAFNEARNTGIEITSDPAVQIADPVTTTPEHRSPPTMPIARGLAVHTATRRDPAAVAEPEERRSVSAPTRESRRGGWMVAQAYGEILPRIAAAAAESAQRAINETV